jgi:hypothetical protein
MICGAEACNLGAMIHSAELRVHFLKSFQKGSTCENLSQKGLKNKKKDGTDAAAEKARVKSNALARERGFCAEGCQWQCYLCTDFHLP